MSDWLASTELDGLTPKQCFTEIFNLVKQAITLDQDLTTNFIELWEIALHKPEVREKVKKAYDIWAEHLSALLERISDDREWTTWLSTALIAFLEGVCVLSAVYGQDSPLVRNLLDNFEKVSPRRVHSEPLDQHLSVPDDHLPVHDEDRIQDDGVDVEARGNLAAEGSVASEGDVDRAVDLLVLQHVADDPGLRVGPDAEFRHGPGLGPDRELLLEPGCVRAFEAHGEAVLDRDFEGPP